MFSRYEYQIGPPMIDAFYKIVLKDDTNKCANTQGA